MSMVDVTEQDVRWMEGLKEILSVASGGSGKPPRKPGKDPDKDPPSDPPKEKPKPKKQPQVITWANPGPVAWGTQISATQRNATTSGDGALTYSVQVGDVLDVGTHTLRVDAAETDGFLAAHATVQLVVTKAPQTITWEAPAGITFGTKLSGTQLNASTSGDGELEYEPKLEAELLPGTHSLKVTAKATAKYLAAEKTVELVVARATQTITWSAPAGITWPTKLSETQLNASTSGDGELTYEPALEAEPLPGTRTLKVTAAATAKYLEAEKTVEIEVAKATPVITWEHPEPVDIGVELDETQLNATCTSDAELEYKPAKGTKTTKAGNLTLRVDAPETAKYEKAFKNVTLKVNKPKQTITWANPADIVYETKLSATQLNATRTKGNGALTYDPALNAQLDPGDHTLKVTAAETTEWAETEKEVTIKVTKAKSVIEWKTPAPIAKNTKIQPALTATVKKGGTTLTYAPDKDTKFTAEGNQFLTVKNNDTTKFFPTRAFVRLQIMDSAESVKGFKETADGTRWKKPSTSPNKEVCDAWDADTDGMKTQGQKLMKDLSQLTGAQIKTYMDALVTSSSDKTYQGGTYPNHIWKFANGLQVRYKPSGDAFSSTPMFCIEGRSSSGFSASQSDIAFKLTGDGVPTAKGPGNSDITMPGGYNSSKKTKFRSGCARSTHHMCRPKEDQVIDWATPPKITLPDKVGPLHLNATLTTGDGALTYTPLSGTKLAAGTRTLSVKAAATDAYKETTKTVNVEVEKGEHVIVWETPDPLPVDTTLWFDRMNATCATAPGPRSLHYDPGPRTTWSSPQTVTLKVTCPETDDYKATTKTVSLQIVES